jgi:hypothetical protein
VGECVTTFAQPHQREWRRQVDGLRNRGASRGCRCQSDLQLPFLLSGE